jgi:hypothetical protein
MLYTSTIEYVVPLFPPSPIKTRFSDVADARKHRATLNVNVLCVVVVILYTSTALKKTTIREINILCYLYRKERKYFCNNKLLEKYSWLISVPMLLVELIFFWFPVFLTTV